MSAREFDLIVYGASGFTGRLVAEYLAKRGITGWAMAGRDQAKLESVRAEVGAPADTPIITANARDRASIEAMAARAKVVITTVGPYQLYGEPLVAACAKVGADYVDLCGEPNWMAEMIAKYDAPAKQSGARIVFSCGFDSIPFDCGVLFTQKLAQQAFGAPAKRVRGRVRVMKGSFSGGTLASLLATLEAAKRDPGVAALMADPFALSPERGAPQPAGDAPLHEPDLGAWSAPFVMAPINTKNVHRTNALTGYLYGRDFVYDEMHMFSGAGAEKYAKGAARQSKQLNAMLAFAPTRALLRTFALPKPGQGPSRQARERGRYEVLFVAEAANGQSVRASVAGDMDPGYGSTSKMISEAALCLASACENTPGGVWTPAAAMGEALIARLEAHAGLTFKPAS